MRRDPAARGTRWDLDKSARLTYAHYPVYQHDYIKRQIELFTEALARLARKRAEGALEEAQREARNAYAALGVDPSLLRLDAASLVRMIQPEKARSLCDLLEAEALVMEAASQPLVAVRLRQQAANIRGVLGT